MSASSLALGRFTSGVLDGTEQARVQVAPFPVIVMPGGGDTALNRFGDFDHIGDAMLDAGFWCYQPSVPSMLGNPTSASRITDAVAYAHANGCAGPPVFIGQSNGASCAFRWAKENETKAIVALIAPLDAQAIYDAGTVEGTDMRAAYEAAFGITYPTPIPTIGNPVDGSYGCPIQVWYASDDDLSLLTQTVYTTAIDAFVALHDAEVHDVGALGHTSAAVAAVTAADVVDFCLALTVGDG